MMLEGYRYSDTQKKKLFSSIIILCDTRQQQNQHIIQYFNMNNINHKNRALPYGDYSFMIPKNPELDIPRDIMFDRHVVIQRKGSLDELCGNFMNRKLADGTLKDGRDRFQKELSLAPKDKVLLIQNCDYGDVCEGNYRSEYSRKSLIGSIHSFWWKYNIPIFFMKDKRYTGVFIQSYFIQYLRNVIK